jgi:hypothetical protein
MVQTTKGHGLMPPKVRYAAYLQATRRNQATNVLIRRQWIVLPPTAAGGVLLEFHREQLSPTSRPIWRHTFVDSDLYTRDLSERIAALTTFNRQNMLEGDYAWTVSPIVTAQVTVPELKVLHETPSTPYKVLRRLEKVARDVHGFTI